MRRMTFEEAMNARRLRLAGMSVPDVVIAMEIYHDTVVTANQVDRLRVRRGRRPARALRAGDRRLQEEARG